MISILYENVNNVSKQTSQNKQQICNDDDDDDDETTGLHIFINYRKTTQQQSYQKQNKNTDRTVKTKRQPYNIQPKHCCNFDFFFGFVFFTALYFLCYFVSIVTGKSCCNIVICCLTQ